MKKLMVIVFLMNSQHLFGQTCCSGGVPVSNTIGLPSADFNGLQFNLSYDYHNLNSLMQENELLDDNIRQRTTATTLLQISKPFGNWFTELMVPYIQQNRNISSIVGTNKVQSGGIGDVAVLLGRSFKNVQVAAGIKAPTGNISQSIDGIRLNADMQNGTGSWDIIAMSRYSKSFNNHVVYIQGFHMERTTKTNFDLNQNYRFGSESQLTAGWGTQFLLGNILSDFGVGARFRNVGANQINKQILPGSGGRWLLANINARIWIIPSTTALALSSDIPLIAKVVGLQNVPTYRMNVSLYHKWSFKK